MAKKPIDYALFLLKIRDRSSGEIKEKMRQKGFSDQEIAETTNFLLDRGFLDDEKFARNYINFQLKIKPQGKYRLQMKLKQLYLPDEIIKEAILEYSPDEEITQAVELAEKWLGRKSGLEEAEKREKLARYLAGRGFNWDTVKKVFDRLAESPDSLT
jgi:regulatory protein